MTDVMQEGVDPVRVRQARIFAGLSQRELAELIGCNVRSVLNWESTANGARRPNGRYMRKLSEATGKPISWFYGVDD